MSSGEPLGLAAGARIGATFRLLMQVRILIALVALFHMPGKRLALGPILVIVGIALLSWLALVGWEQIAPWLLRYPMLLALDLSVAFAVLWIGTGTGPFFLFTVVTSVIAGLFYSWRGGALICLLQVLLYCAIAVASRLEFDYGTHVGMPLFYLVAVFTGFMLRRLYDDHARLDDVRRRAEVAVVAAEERARLAREMHDSLVKTLHGIAIAAKALPVWLERSPNRAMTEAQRIASAAEIAAREAREILKELREDTVQLPLGTALPELVNGWAARTGVPVAVTAPAEIDLPLRQRYEVIAILREALENIARHADPSGVEVVLSREKGQVLLSVKDDGGGFTISEEAFDRWAEEGHYGLAGMRERAVRAGGLLTVESEAGAGTTVTVAVPEAESEIFPRRSAEVV